ncbi:uncharacterized protein V6R79_013400, partial [Siganus canaliculatus]
LCRSVMVELSCVDTFKAIYADISTAILVTWCRKNHFMQTLSGDTDSDENDDDNEDDPDEAE